ncbi:hydantoinase/oxoprolinase family protein [Candidatus Solirubrobacter pratensis]|uniref:hydantoinase/oxoprolinase family protein n=1 Tax=Candidatus Solirubrobacter pratensis TaxID=1298857 RepID=UPI00041858E9|nr:hydantoinase/oxoprolinase family protein [Candidatus Solirubrobacter pratensis]
MGELVADGFYVASDVGGTFTDTVVSDASGVLHRYKAASTPGNLVGGVLATCELAGQERGLGLSEFMRAVKLFSQGTTVATNGLLQRRGATVGTLHTAGFGDTLFVSRAWKAFGMDEAALKNFRHLVKPRPFVERRLTREVSERVDYKGQVLRPLDEDAARTAVRELLDEGAEAFVVSLLWSFKHPEHEQRVKQIVLEEAPDAFVTASSDLLPRINEYERTVTAVVNAFLGPDVARSTRAMHRELQDAGLSSPPLLMLSNGGVGAVAQVADEPVSILLSGPVGGVVGSRFVGEQLGERNVITTDMGGTSFDVGMVVDGRPLIQASTVMANQPIATPSVAIATIGAGGGSIARAGNGLLTVGPESAGAVPGPACYGEGGTEPTVTDADVVLGLINPENFLGGRIRLDPERARHAIRERIAGPLGLSVEDAAAGIKRIVDSKMADLVRSVTIHKGFDPREFVLLAFGGAGPVHAHAYGAELGVKRLIVPVTASVHSAYGILASDLVITRAQTRSFFTPPGSEGASGYVDAGAVNSVLDALERDARETMSAQSVPPGEIETTAFVDMRFRFQIHELTVEIPARPITADGLDALVARFIENYELRFGEGSAFTAAGVEMVTWRVVMTGRLAKPSLAAGAPHDGAGVHEPRRRPVYLGGGWHDAAIYDETALRLDSTFSGPAIVELPDTTIVVGVDQVASVDANRNVFLEAEGSR